MARTKLPTSVDALHQLVEDLQATVDEQASRIAFLEEWRRLINAQRFGSRSEKVPAEQRGLFNEAELEAARAIDGEGIGEDVIDVPGHTRRKCGRRPLPDFLPVVEQLHDLSDEEKVCSLDSAHQLTEIGRETSDQLVFIPARVEILRHVRPKYACATCRQGVKIAAMPPQPIPKSLATPSLLAQVATAKYVDALPLHRQEKIFQRLGLDISRATLASWMMRMGALVQPLVDRIQAEIRASGVVQCDETPFQVLKEPGKRAESHSYLWAMRGGDVEHPLIYYEYDPSRSAEVPKRLLRGFEGFLQTDGYEGYTAIGQEPGIVHVGCWAHARRKFDEALRGQKPLKKGAKQSSKASRARQALSQIQQLYAIERTVKEATAEDRHRVRQERSKPVMEKLRAWIDASLGSVPPQSLTGKALYYLDRQWPKLVRVLEDGRLPLDTNRVENAIRPFVLGRKNWLFADTVAGAKASANLYGLIETAKANGIEPWVYLTCLFDALPRATSPSEIEALLPRNVDTSALETR